MRTTSLKGLQNVINNLNKEIKKIEGATIQGLIKSSIIIRRDMDQTTPMIPVDWGNLRASWITVAKGVETNNAATFKGETPYEKKKAAQMAVDHKTILSQAKGEVSTNPSPMVVMGFTANYAEYVHELGETVRPGVEINWSRPGSGARFFQSALERNRDKILETIAKEARV